MLNTLLLIGGLALILAGANGLTDASAAVAKRFRISDLVIGLTIVAFASYMPETKRQFFKRGAEIKKEKQAQKK